MSRIFIVLTAVLCLLTFVSCGDPDDIITTKAELDQKLQTFASWDRVSGFAVSIFDEDGVIFENGYGFSNREAEIPYTGDTRQTIASISKIMIGIALMKAQEIDLLSLDDPINDYLPFKVVNPHFPDSPITIRHLAMHTSSIAYSETMTDERVFEYRDMNTGQFLKQYLSEGEVWYSDDNFHHKRPGALGDYSNVGAALAAYIIEQASGVSFDDFTNTHIIIPLKLSDTYWHRSDATKSDVLYYATEAKDEFTQKLRVETPLYPVDGLVTNVKDLAVLCQAIMNGGGNVLTPESVHEMLDLKSIKSLDEEIQKQGVIWYSTKGQLGIPKTVIGHSGGDASSFTMMFYDPKTKIGYILLSNTALNERTHVAMFNIYKSLWLYTKHRQD